MDKTDHDLAECVAAAQAAALGSAPWEALLERMASAFPGAKVALVSEQPRPLRSIGLIAHGYEASLVQDFVHHYSQINPWAPHWTRTPILTASVSDDVLPSSLFKNSEFYEFIKRAGEAESAAGIKLFDDGHSYAILNLHFGSRYALRYNESIPRFLNAFAPHLNSAVQLNARVAVLTEPVHTLEQAVWQFPSAAFLIDRLGAVRAANDSGRSLIAEGRAAKVDEGDRLWIAEEGARSRLTALLTATDGMAPRKVASATNSYSPWQLFVFGSNIPSRRVAWLPDRKNWVLAVFESKPHIASPLERAQGFGLTPQEARIATAIVGGLRVDAIAHSLGISIATVRQHLKAIFAKTNTHRQAELISKLVHSGR